jgi:hypothetical protein
MKWRAAARSLIMPWMNSFFLQPPKGNTISAVALFAGLSAGP